MTRSAWIGALLVLAATVAAYSPAMRAPYEFDDITSIPGNPSLRSLRPDIALFPPPNTSVSGRPVVNYSFALDDAINRVLHVDTRPDPDGSNKTVVHHAGNLLIHLTCGLLLFLLLRPPLGEATALTVAALWLLHPLQTEAVNYLVQRTELLVSLLYLVTLYAGARAWDASSNRGRWLWSVAAFSSFAVGLGCKEVILTAPLMLLLYDRVGREVPFGALWARHDRRVLYLALAALDVAAVVMFGTSARAGTVGFGLGIPWYAYLLSQGWAILHYLRLVILPRGQTIDYGYQPVTGWPAVVGSVAVFVLLCATVLALRRRGRWKWLAVLCGAFFLLLAPSSSVVPITTEVAAERRMYLALAPVIMACVAGFNALPWGRSSGRLIPLVVAIAAVLALTTAARSRLYQDPEALWRDAVAHAPRNARAYDNLAATMFYHDPPQQVEARALYEHAIALDPEYVHAYTGLASVAVNEHRFSDAEQLLRRVLLIQPGYSDAVAHLGQLYLRMQQPAKAVPYLAQFASAFPSADAWLELGRAQMLSGHLDPARTSLAAALQLAPTRPDIMHYLGGLLAEAGDGAHAIPLLERAITSGRGTATDVGLLALSYAEAGRGADAAEAANAAVAQANGNAAVYVLAGRAVLTAGRTRESATYFAEALRIDAANTEARAWLNRARASGGK